MTVKREIELSEEDVAYIDAKADAGDGDASSVLGTAIKMLREEDAFIDRWVQEVVVPTYDRWKAGEEKAYTSDEVFARLRARIKEAAAKKAS